nr:PREDICTED: uncharacterized protein LOC108222385 isoform X2 [Daucus carota subsp. sativus]
MKEANYNHLRLDNFPTLRSDGSGSTSKRRRQVFHSNREKTLRDEGAVIEADAQATPSQRPPLSNLTNQSYRQSGSGFTASTEKTPLANNRKYSLLTPGSVLNMNAPVSSHDQSPLSNVTSNHNGSSSTGIFCPLDRSVGRLPLAQTNRKRDKRATVFNSSGQTGSSTRHPLSNITNQIPLSPGTVFNSSGQTGSSTRHPLSNITNQIPLSPGSVLNMNGSMIDNDKPPLSNVTIQHHVKSQKNLKKTKDQL